MITVQVARVAEAERIRLVLPETWLDTYASLYSAAGVDEVLSTWHAVEGLTRQIRNPRVYFGTAKLADETIVGVISAKQLADGALQVNRLYVLPPHQRRGIGSALLREALEAFAGTMEVETVVEEGHPKGQAFWRRAGFQAVGHKRRQIGDVEMGLVVMERKNRRSLPGSGTPAQ